MTRGSYSRPRADALAAQLDLDLDIGICLACLSFVSSAIDHGDAADVARQVRRMTPYLWHEGLADPALAAVRRAFEDDVTDACVALDDLERLGPRSVFARAIVLRLATALSMQTRAMLRIYERARERRPLEPDLN